MLTAHEQLVKNCMPHRCSYIIYCTLKVTVFRNVSCIFYVSNTFLSLFCNVVLAVFYVYNVLNIGDYGDQLVVTLYPSSNQGNTDKDTQVY